MQTFANASSIFPVVSARWQHQNIITLMTLDHTTAVTPGPESVHANFGFTTHFFRADEREREY